MSLELFLEFFAGFNFIFLVHVLFKVFADSVRLFSVTRVYTCTVHGTMLLLTSYLYLST